MRAERSGHVTAIHAEEVGRATMLLGAGRDRVDDTVDSAVGAVVKALRGEEVRVGQALAEVHYRDTARLSQALALLNNAWVIGDEKPLANPLILASMDEV